MTLAVINSGISNEVKRVFIMNGNNLVECKAVWAKTNNTPYQVFQPTIDIEINTTVYDVNLQDVVKGILGYTPTYPINVNVIIGSNGVVGQSTTVTGTGFSRLQVKNSIAAMQTGTFTAGSTITITNNGYIVGCGGQGGDGNDGVTEGIGTRWAGGDALYATFACTVYNNGTIAGGGGGGKGGDGGGGNSTAGGGGAGSMGGVGGWGWGSGPDRFGGTGTLTTGGLGTHDTGDEGGNLGQKGGINYGHDGWDTSGHQGAYVVGNSYVTWATTGTRLGDAL